MKITCYSEEELLGGCNSYQERFRSLFPYQYEHAFERITNTLVSKLQLPIKMWSMNKDLQELIFRQLMLLNRICHQMSPFPHWCWMESSMRFTTCCAMLGVLKIHIFLHDRICWHGKIIHDTSSYPSFP